MKEELIKISNRDGAIDTFIARPADYGPFPPVFIYMDVWGLREELFDVARRSPPSAIISRCANFYYRQGPVRHEFRNSKGEMITLDRLPADQKAKSRPRSRSSPTTWSSPIPQLFSSTSIPIGVANAARSAALAIAWEGGTFFAPLPIFRVVLPPRPVFTARNLGIEGKEFHTLQCRPLAARSIAASAKGTSIHRIQRWRRSNVRLLPLRAGAPGMSELRVQRRRPRLCASLPRCVRQASGQSRLGNRFRDVSPAADGIR